MRVDAPGDLSVGLGDDVVHNGQADEVADRDRRRGTPDHERDRPHQIRPIGEDDREHRALDRDHQRGDDHGADHRRRGVGDDTGRGDDRGEDQQHPEPAGPLRGVGSLEEDSVSHPDDLVGSKGRHGAHLGGRGQVLSGVSLAGTDAGLCHDVP